MYVDSMSFAHVLFDGFDLKYADTADLRGYIGQVLDSSAFPLPARHRSGLISDGMSRTLCSLVTTMLARSSGASRAATRQTSTASTAFWVLECPTQVHPRARAPMLFRLFGCGHCRNMSRGVSNASLIAGESSRVICVLTFLTPTISTGVDPRAAHVRHHRQYG